MSYGDGTITLRRDGRLQVTVWVLGKPHYRTVGKRVKDPKAARKLAERYRRELVALREAEVDPTSQTLADYLASWLDGLERRRRVRPRTVEHYRGIVALHIVPHLGRHKLGALRERHVQAWLDADPAAPRTVHHHRAVLRRALNMAVRQRLIPSNPAIAVELPALEAFDGDPLTADEARALLTATAGDRLHPLWRLAMATGLRLSELLGLAREDVDADGRIVTSSLALARRNGEWLRVPAKAARKVERIAIDEGTAEVMRRHLLAMAAERQPGWRYHGLVFLRPNGLPYSQATIWQAFQVACDKAGIRRRRFHDLRMTSATIMRDVGVSEETRQARLGHATTAMSRHYAKPSDRQDRDAADKLGEALG